MMRRFRLAMSCLAIAVGTLGPLGQAIAVAETAGPGAAPSVLVVPVAGTVDQGMAHLVDRAVDEADAAGEPLVIDVNTPGGEVESAFAIRDSLFRAKVPVIAFVSERAYSAGALITLAANTIVMAPGSSIGAAEPIYEGPDQSHQAKFVSALSAEFRSTAERNHRSGLLATAMVDKNVDAPPWKAKGAILTLTATEAKKAGIADAIASSLEDALVAAKLGHPQIAHAEMSFAEQLVRFATSPEVSGILLSIGALGIIVEMQTLHGIAGVIGVLALALFFGTHVYAGFGNALILVLALAGVAGIVLELHVIPGHGVAGVAGVVLLLASVVLSFGAGAGALIQATQALAIAVLVFTIGLIVLVRMHPENAFIKRIAMRSVQGPQYVTSSDFSELVGKTGTAASLLRPAGVATFEGRRVDVLTKGDFIQVGSPVRVERVEGARIYVVPFASPESLEELV